MGACFSSSTSLPPPPPTAKLVSLNGDLREYPPLVSVSQVLRAEFPTTVDVSSASGSGSGYFICNSDFLSYDEPIPALRSDALLLPNHLYFLLPVTKLNSTLTAPEMAALAVRASQALQTSDRGSSKKSSSISPLLFLDDSGQADYYTSSSSSSSVLKEPARILSARQLRRSGSIKKLQRYASRRAKLAVSSFKLRMATIYEGL